MSCFYSKVCKVKQLIRCSKNIPPKTSNHQNIKPVESNYRTLKTGEYVEFTLDSNCEGSHSEQAVNVTGVLGLELQCDFISRANKKRKT